MSTKVALHNSTEIATTDEPRLSDDAKRFMLSSKAANTRRSYRTQWAAWEAYAVAQDIPPLPPHPVSVANWLASRAAAGQTLSTLRTAVAAVRAAAEAAGETFDTRHPAIRQALAGIGRENAREIAQAKPLRPDLIRRVLDCLSDRPQDLRDGALLALGYVFGLRRSEVAGIDLDRLGDGDSVLRISVDELELTEVRGKTLRGGKQRTRYVPRSANAQAVALIERWLATAGIEAGQPVFRRVLKGGAIGGRLHADNVGKIIKARLTDYYMRAELMSPEAAAAAADEFSGHSLRVGFAVAAANAGADVGAIARAGGWLGPTMPERYTRQADGRKTSPHRLDGVGLK